MFLDPDAGRSSPILGMRSRPSWSTSGKGGEGGAWAGGSGAWAGWGGDSWSNEGGWAAPGIVDSEALIAIELCFVKGEGDSEDLRIANILFNNLDVIG